MGNTMVMAVSQTVAALLQLDLCARGMAAASNVVASADASECQFKAWFVVVGQPNAVVFLCSVCEIELALPICNMTVLLYCLRSSLIVMVTT